MQNFILKVVVGTEIEADLETGLRYVAGEVRKTNINEMFESTRVAFGDEVGDANVVAKGCEPELWDCCRATGSTLGEWRVIRIVLERCLDASIDLLRSGWR